MSRPKFIVGLAGAAALCLATTAQGASVTTLDLSGVEYPYSFAEATVLTFEVTATDPVVGISWDLTVSTLDYDPSWTRDFQLTITAPGATPDPTPGSSGNLTLTGGWDQGDVDFDWSGGVATRSHAGFSDLLDGWNAFGTWEVRVWDSFSDHPAGAYEGQITSGDISVHAVPLPAAGWAGLALLGVVGGAGALRRRCRTA